MSAAEQVQELANKIKDSLTIDNSNGVISGPTIGEGEPTLYEKLLPENLTPDTVKAVKTYDTQFVAGTTRAVTELAKNAYANNADLNSASHTLGMFGKDTVTVTASRDGSVEVSVTNRAADTNSGQLKVAVKEFKAAMNEAKAD